MQRGEIWLVGLDPAEGASRASGPDRVAGGFQPGNQSTRCTADRQRRGFCRRAGFAVPLTGGGTKTTAVVRCDQPRALDLGARDGRKLEAVPDAIMDEVLARLAPIFE
jgi:mRNA-degrading endonuclease toxin of MazEF toxin-antitoxin module